MSGQISWYVSILFLSAGISAGMAIFLQRWRHTPGIGSFSIQSLFLALWSLSFGLEAISTDFALKVFLHKVAWMGVLGGMLFWLLFVFRYTRKDKWLTPAVLAFILGAAGLILAGIFTNDLHHLFWSSYTLSADGNAVIYERGILYWLLLGFLYSIMLVGLFELVITGVNAPRVYFRQILLLVIGVVIPSVLNILYQLRLTPFDLTPVGFMMMAVVVVWAIYSYRLFSLLPVARDRMVETLSEGLLALDMQNRVIDANPFLLKLTGIEKVPIGEPLENLLKNTPDLADAAQGGSEKTSRIVLERSLGRYFEVSLSPLTVRETELKGRLVAFRDITQSEKTVKSLRASEENFRDLFDINPFPVAIVGDETHIYEVNQAVLEYLGTTREAIIGQRASSFFIDPGLYDELGHELDEKGLIHDRPLRIRHPNGEQRYVLLNAHPFLYYNETRILLSFVDITERERADAAEHEQRVLAEVLREMADLLNSTLDLDEVLDRILENLGRVVRHEVANILLVNEDNIAAVARTRGYAEHGRENPYGKVWFSVDNTPNLQQMVKNRTQVIVPDVLNDPGWIRLEGQEWIRCHLGAPVFTQEGIAGFINVDSSIAGFYNQTDAEHLQIFANQAGIAIQNARLYSQLQKAAREGEIFQQISRALSSSLDFEHLISDLLELIGRLVPSDSAGVSLIEGDEFVLKAMRGMDESGKMIGRHWPLKGTANQMVLEKGASIHFPDVQALYSSYREYPHNMVRSVLILPLIAAGEVIGFLSLDSWVLNHFTADDERLANSFASDVALALRNSRLYDETQRRLKVQSILNEVTRVVTSRLELEKLLELIWQQISRFLDARYFLINAKNSMGEWYSYYVREDDQVKPPHVLKGSAGALGYVLETGRPVFLRDKNEVDVFTRITGSSMPFENTRAVMIVPMRVSEKTLGAMGILSVEQDDAFSDEDYELFTSITSQVAISIENARLFEETRSRAEELATINKTGLAVTSGLELKQVLRTLYEQCRQVIPADTFYVAFYDDLSGDIEFPLFHDEGIDREVPTKNIKGESGVTGLILREGKTLYLQDTLNEQTAEKYHLARLGGTPTQSYLGVPLLLRDKVIGVISMQSIKPYVYTPDHIRLLETIATQAAIAIDNARLYEEAQRAATTDFLTGLLNRRELFNRAEMEFERARRYRHDLAVMMIDIDHFKTVNDTYGHLAGDQALRVLSRICQENMRLVDVVGRYGGEEILILMPETDHEHAMLAAERLRQQIEAMKVETESGDVTMTVSIGVADFNRDRTLTLETLIGRADAALFAAKDAGRNRVSIAK
jgi:diguanylate cyclase (GGDEF)-like protein/PAS domain S-box-containing protein